MMRMKEKGIPSSLIFIFSIILSGCATSQSGETVIGEPTLSTDLFPTATGEEIAITRSEILVPNDYPTIQTAIDSAQIGDVIIVSSGVYTEQIDFHGKDLVVRSTNSEDPEVVDSTVLKCSQSDAIALFQNRETNDSRLEGFTITNCSHGGIWVLNGSSPTIVGNTIEGNKGDGILVQFDSSPRIENNTIRNNDESGIQIVFSSSATITYNTISDNGFIGIFVAENSSATIEHNTISGNSVTFAGGGIAIANGSSATITDNIIIGNNAMMGGGLSANGTSSILVENNEFLDNVAFERGGAIWVPVDSDLFLNDPDNNVYQGNQPDDVLREK